MVKVVGGYWWLLPVVKLPVVKLPVVKVLVVTSVVKVVKASFRWLRWLVVTSGG